MQPCCCVHPSSVLSQLCRPHSGRLGTLAIMPLLTPSMPDLHTARNVQPLVGLSGGLCILTMLLRLTKCKVDT